MGTETVSKPVMDNGSGDSDDDKPLAFKRNNTVASNSNQSKSNSQRSKAVPTTKVSPMRSPVTSPNGTTPSNKTSIVKSSMPSSSSKASPAKSPLRNDMPSTVKDRSQLQKDQSECKIEHEDSEDDRPLSSILSGNKGPTSSRQVSSPQPEKKNNGDRPLDRASRIIKDESDDETPISSMFRKKIDSGMSGGNQLSNDEKKPLVQKLHQNGSTVKNEVPNGKVLGKRPLEKNSSADQSSLKKAKISASPTSVKMKQDSVKKEIDDKGRVLVSPKMKAKQLSTREDGTDDDDDDDDDDEADTVGCCTLKVGNVECIPPNKIKFDFLGKDSIQYVNTVEVEPLVYKAIGQFQAGKSKTDDLFDELDTSKLNAHLKELVPGLTAKVFRTYNASITLDEMLSQETKDGDVTQKIVVYQKANKEVAIICNHQRTVSKTHGAQIEKLTARIEELKEVLKELKTNLDRAKKGKPPLEGSDGKKIRSLEPNAWEKKIAQQSAKIEKMERDMHTKEDLKTVALGTSKINYLDPRITVAWCKRHEVPIEKIFTKSLLEKFAWAMDVEPEYRFSRR
ncbi:DNA topoisomerase I alpha [Arabidopsis thaliana]|uniref:DNA topoisomerase n=1 Tax=Arabidopsis thaliana TaxID=3702 RepID=F4K3F5_ARATH|nr:DNA topoisomerase I alpha [Arabidopsis thaliana]AED96614.1 DNA topoisomerase I alpha [Arabidopsis thaliana]|eukprot:NP_001190544.1 DNA topoisomerase I alpha [Arabidopsis thaliana]